MPTIYFYTWCGLSENLECMSEMCCMRLAENTGRKKSAFWHHRITLSGYIFGTNAHLSILWAGVQPTLDPYAEAFYSRRIALTLGGEEFSVNVVCKCMRDCRVGWAE